MTNEDKQLIADYMTWEKDKLQIGYWRPVDNDLAIVNFDPNDASLCVQEMQKRGDWEYFVGDIEDTLIYTRYHKEHHSYKAVLAAWLLNAENFFNAMSEWLRERGNEEL